MATWGEFTDASPELADFGAERFRTAEVAYLATVRSDARPRVHPVTPIIGGGRLFVFMERTSPKGHDLRRNDRYALHSLVMDQHGTGGEFLVSGKARSVEDPAARAVARAAAPYKPEDHYVLFELLIERASSTVYEDGQPVRKRWEENKAPDPNSGFETS